MKVPLIIVTGVICFGVGVGAGMLAVMTFAADLVPHKPDNNPGGPPPGIPGAGGQPGMMMGQMGVPLGMGGAGGMRGPSPKSQLVALVGKLDALTHKPLSVSLNEKQRADLADQLKGLDQEDELTDKVAGERLTAALKVVEDQKDTLEAAGYRWPGEGGGFGGRPQEVPNPFKEEKAAGQLKSLQEQLKGKGP